MAYRITSRFVRPNTDTDLPMLNLVDSDYNARTTNYLTWLDGRSDTPTSTWSSEDGLTFEFRFDFTDEAAALAFKAAYDALDKSTHDPQDASAYKTYMTDNNITYTTVMAEV